MNLCIDIGKCSYRGNRIEDYATLLDQLGIADFFPTMEELELLQDYVGKPLECIVWDGVKEKSHKGILKAGPLVHFQNSDHITDSIQIGNNEGEGPWSVGFQFYKKGDLEINYIKSITDGAGKAIYQIQKIPHGTYKSKSS